MTKRFCEHCGIRISCPKCHCVDIVEIIYGYPTDKAFEMEARGEIYLGGCCIEYDENGKVNPDYHCNACGNDFGHEDKCIHAKAETEVEK